VPQNMCAECPWRAADWQFVKKIKQTLRECYELGILEGPHACHMVQKDFVPCTPQEECAGHRQYLNRGIYGQEEKEKGVTPPSGDTV
jgi:hypothetical protein